MKKKHVSCLQTYLFPATKPMFVVSSTIIMLQLIFIESDLVPRKTIISRTQIFIVVFLFNKGFFLNNSINLYLFSIKESVM